MLRGATRTDEAVAALREAAARSPRSALAWNELGLALREQGHFPDAAAAYTKAVTLDAGYAAAWRNQAVLQDLYLADPAAALQSFERYKALAPDDKAVGGWLAELRQRVDKASGAARPAAAQAGAKP
jgi:Flp pilus assembly protein TadD